MIGQMIVVIGCYHHSFTIMFAGRVVLGYGSESMTAAQNVYITHFFQDDKLAFPISMGNTTALFGTYLNYKFTAGIAKKYGLMQGFLSGMFICIFSLITIFIAIGIDFIIEKNLESTDGEAVLEENNEKSQLITKKNEEIENKSNEKTNYLSKIPSPFWPLLLCSVIIYASNIGFNNIAVSYFVEKWFPNLDVKSAEVSSSQVISFDSFTNILSSFFLAIMMHYANSYLHIFNTITALISLISFTLFMFSIYPLIPLILDGIASSLNYNILNTLIPNMVEEKYLGVAYGISVASNNLGTSIIPVITAFLRNFCNNYDLAISFFIFLNVVGLVSAVIFYYSYRDKFLLKQNKEKDEEQKI